MSQTAYTQEATTVEVSKQTAARVGRVIDVFPSCKSITESTHLSGTFDTFNDAGIPVPDAALALTSGAAGLMSGDRACYAVFRDNDRNVIGNPSPISNTLSSLSSKQIDIDLTPITNEYDNTRTTYIDIYVNLSTGGSVYYYVTTVVRGTAAVTINVTDATIQANDTLELDNDAPAAETYGAVVSHKGFTFLVGPHSDVVSEYEDDWTYSKVNSADQFPALNRTKAEPGMYGRLNIAVPTGDALIFYKERAIYELHFDQDPSGIFGDGYAKTVNTHRGTVNKRTVANVQGVHFVMDRLGIYVFSGGTAYREIGTKLHHYWNRINWARKEWFTAVVGPDRVVFFVALDNETECKYAFVLDLNAWYSRSEANWYVYRTDQGIRDACNWMVGNGAAAIDNGMSWTPTVALLTEYGYTGYLAAGYRDMVDPLLTATGTTTSAGTTTTFVDSGATWQRTNAAGSTVNPVGAYVRFINPNADRPGSADWSQAYRVTGYSGTGPTLTFTPAAPENVPSGTTYVIGAIPEAVMKSPVYSFDVPFRKKRIARIGVEFQPGGTEHYVNMQLYADRRITSLTRETRSTSQYDSTDRLPGVNLKLGGSATTGGRVGAHAEPGPGRAFANLQLVLSGHIYGGHALDCPSVIDTVLLDGLEQDLTTEAP